MATARRSGGRTGVAAPPQHWRFTADQYQQMGEAGIFRREDRVELLEGEIYAMTPIGSWHNGSVAATAAIFFRALDELAIVWVRGSFRLSPRSEPEPDIAILRFRDDFYRFALPGPEDVLLLVEVADTSLGYDRDFKLPLYAHAGIPEAWIANRTDMRVEIYREPRNGRYQVVSLHERGDAIAPLAFPDLTMPVAAILG